MSDSDYVHGYSDRENLRLADQANVLGSLLHHDTRYPAGSIILECGCGTGAQTVFLASGSPGARIVSLDLALGAVRQARGRIRDTGYANVSFQNADIFHLPFLDGAFDHLFVCFVLEHLLDPVMALRSLMRVLTPGGSITVIEGDHGSWYSHPQTREASRAVQCLIEAQTRLGGDPLIGRHLYPLLLEAGFRDVGVTPRMVHVDASRPDLVEGFSRKTFIAMVEGVRERVLSMGLVDSDGWEKGIADLYRATEPDGTFCYTFFKARAVR
jgi:ubiquinone/menaquinone biosynthesis C-methylase UbiE